jgi:hypothetical protein
MMWIEKKNIIVQNYNILFEMHYKYWVVIIIAIRYFNSLMYFLWFKINYADSLKLL